MTEEVDSNTESPDTIENSVSAPLAESEESEQSEADRLAHSSDDEPKPEEELTVPRLQ